MRLPTARTDPTWRREALNTAMICRYHIKPFSRQQAAHHSSTRPLTSSTNQRRLSSISLHNQHDSPTAAARSSRRKPTISNLLLAHNPHTTSFPPNFY